MIKTSCLDGRFLGHVMIELRSCARAQCGGETRFEASAVLKKVSRARNTTEWHSSSQIAKVEIVLLDRSRSCSLFSDTRSRCTTETARCRSAISKEPPARSPPPSRLLLLLPLECNSKAKIYAVMPLDRDARVDNCFAHVERNCVPHRISDQIVCLA